ncbi:mitotic spindle checkpoint protein MAD2-like [Asparagus officinalis]|uniref:mitotic spindle checkpoint protein MAD2-like n=1 Tax=Asparagus officinalis TaxID=4686 RepID=UPI00098E5FB9|nr:mitotic spindle checkpoint protein MAD2-like [Asparagus officinalis]
MGVSPRPWNIVSRVLSISAIYLSSELGITAATRSEAPWGRRRPPVGGQICFAFECVFDVLAYTDKDVAVPFTWIESDAKLIQNPQMVKLHSFDPKIHIVDTLISYKNGEWDEK